MSAINILGVTVLDNPCNFRNAFQFDITFECTQELKDDIEWKVVYVGNPEDSQKDQVLEEVMVGPIAMGVQRFLLQVPAPDASLIAHEDLLGVTVILITCSYKSKLFIQIGYYVNNEYDWNEEEEKEYLEDLKQKNNAITDASSSSSSAGQDDQFEESATTSKYPKKIDIDRVYRNILADKPKVTRFPIDWEGDNDLMLDEAGQTMEEEEADDGLISGEGEEMEEDEEEDEEDDGEVDLEDEEEEGEEDEEGEEGEGEEDDEEEGEEEEGEEGDEEEDDEAQEIEEA